MRCILTCLDLWLIWMLRGIRGLVRRRPRLRAALLPYWMSVRHLRWQVRKAATRRKPITYRSGNITRQLHPEGQIPEAVWDGDFERHERDFVAVYVRRGMRVINIGANVGLYAVLASALVGEEGSVYAFEPSSLSYARLLRNLDLNGCTNVIAARLAVADSNLPLVLRVDARHPGYDGHAFVEKTHRVPTLLRTDEMVECCTLDDYLAAAGVAGFDFLIMDIEGAEYWALKGASKSLAYGNATLMLECSRNQLETKALLEGLGYRFWSWDEAGQTLQPADFQALARTGNIICRREPWSRPT